jgi:hypothetical protein
LERGALPGREPKILIVELERSSPAITSPASTWLRRFRDPTVGLVLIAFGAFLSAMAGILAA